MKKSLKIISGLFALILITASVEAIAQEEPEVDEQQVMKGVENNAFSEDNEACFVCHGEPYYQLSDTAMGVSVKRLMCDDYYVDRDKYYQSNHWSFACSDCHSYDLNIFPHPTSARLEESYTCDGCHGFDESDAQYHFGDISNDYNESVHADVEGFNCWKCHDPHTYELTIRKSDDYEAIILYDNNMCLECHANYSNYQLLSEKDETIVIDKHSWLPNQSAHFKSVRCIECHTQINDSTMVAHKVMPIADAVKNCTECHSSDSRLMATLYKFRSQEERRNDGFVNGVILNQSYVIGANRNVFLNWLSFIIAAGVMGVVAIHVFFRIIKR